MPSRVLRKRRSHLSVGLSVSVATESNGEKQYLKHESQLISFELKLGRAHTQAKEKAAEGWQTLRAFPNTRNRKQLPFAATQTRSLATNESEHNE